MNEENFNWPRFYKVLGEKGSATPTVEVPRSGKTDRNIDKVCFLSKHFESISEKGSDLLIGVDKKVIDCFIRDQARKRRH